MKINRFAIAGLLLLATSVYGQQTPQAPALQPTPEELAFARLPADIQRMLAGMTPAQAMQTIAQAGQQSIATGNPQPTQEQFRGTLGAVLSPYGGYISASAGASSFPPLSPLVAPPPPPFLR